MADLLEQRVRELVRAELAALGVATVFTSTQLPPGIRSREHFASECRRLHIGEKHGREWRVDAAVWRAKREASRRRPTPTHASATLEAKADAALEASGLRLVKGSTRA